MKQSTSSARAIRTASDYRRRRIGTCIRILLRVLLVLTTCIFTWCMDLGCAFGWIQNARAGENWPLEFVGYGQMMIAASVLLTAGAVLVLLCRKNWVNWAAAGCGTIGITLCMIAMYRITSYAADSAFYSKLMDLPADTLYRMEILPTWIPYGCILALALMQFFSPEARDIRAARRRQAEQKAPSILEEPGQK